MGSLPAVKQSGGRIQGVRLEIGGSPGRQYVVENGTAYLASADGRIQADLYKALGVVFARHRGPFFSLRRGRNPIRGMRF